MSVCCFARVDPNQILLFQCTIQEAQIIWRELHIILRITDMFHESFSAKCVSNLVRQHLCVLCCYQKIVSYMYVQINIYLTFTFQCDLTITKPQMLSLKVSLNCIAIFSECLAPMCIRASAKPRRRLLQLRKA